MSKRKRWFRNVLRACMATYDRETNTFHFDFGETSEVKLSPKPPAWREILAAYVAETNEVKLSPKPDVREWLGTPEPKRKLTVAVTINQPDTEYSTTFVDVESLDDLLRRVSMVFPKATSLVLAFQVH